MKGAATPSIDDKTHWRCTDRKYPGMFTFLRAFDKQSFHMRNCITRA